MPASVQSSGGINATGFASHPVSEHMSTAVLQVDASTLMPKVALLLATRHISCAVVTENGQPAGVISERDIVRTIATEYERWHDLCAADIMTRPVRTILAEATVAEAMQKLEQNRVRRLPVLSADGVLGGIVTQSDLLRAVHQSLQNYALDLARRRDDLVNVTVHDIKNWLHAADSAIEVAGEDTDEAEEMLTLARHALLGIRQLVYVLLDVNRLESGTMPFRPSEHVWERLSQPVLAEARVLARAKAVTIDHECDGDLKVWGDHSMVERVLLNLLDNAINAAPRETTVEVSARRLASGGGRVQIGNRGPVIPRNALPTLFEKYRQGPTDSRAKGWGLGLTFCRLAIDRHGGTIVATSPYVDGEGAAFAFTLPPRFTAVS